MYNDQADDDDDDDDVGIACVVCAATFNRIVMFLPPTYKMHLNGFQLFMISFSCSDFERRIASLEVGTFELN